jgi:hypothetical protein
MLMELQENHKKNQKAKQIPTEIAWKKKKDSNGGQSTEEKQK